MAKEKKPLPCNRAELADYYGISRNTLKRWLLRLGLDVPARVRLSPPEMRNIIQRIGSLRELDADPLEAFENENQDATA